MAKHESNFESESQIGALTGCMPNVIGAGFVFLCAYSGFNNGDISVGIGFTIIGIVALLIGYGKGLNRIYGSCPYCGHKIITYKTELNTKCKACRKLIVIKDDKLIGMD